jgi:hypothetical protein
MLLINASDIIHSICARAPQAEKASFISWDTIIKDWRKLADSKQIDLRLGKLKSNALYGSTIVDEEYDTDYLSISSSIMLSFEGPTVTAAGISLDKDILVKVKVIAKTERDYSPICQTKDATLVVKRSLSLREYTKALKEAFDFYLENSTLYI